MIHQCVAVVWQPQQSDISQLSFSWRSAAWTPIALWPVLLRDASAAGNLLLAGRVAPRLWQAAA